MNEKRIYEWLRPELKRPLTEWGLQYGVDGPEAAVVDWDASTTKTIPLLPLDYNTLHNEVAPRLQTGGYEITWTGIDGRWYIDPIVSTAEINRDVTESVAAAAALALTGKVPSWYLNAEALEGRVRERFSSADWREALDALLEAREAQ